MHDRLVHDAAFVLGQKNLALVAHLLREEECREAFDEFYRLAKDAISRFAEASARERRRLHPGTKGGKP